MNASMLMQQRKKEKEYEAKVGIFTFSVFENVLSMLELTILSRIYKLRKFQIFITMLSFRSKNLNLQLQV